MYTERTPFYPAFNVPTIVTSVASANVALPDRDPTQVRQLQIANNATAWAFVRQGTSSAVVATADVDYAVPPGGVVVITISNLTTHIAAVLDAGTGELYLTLGEGL